MSAPRIRGHRRAGRLEAHSELRHFGLSVAAIAAIVTAAAAVAGGATTAIMSSQQAQATSEYNEEIASQQAELARRAGKAAEADTREQNARLMALQRAQLGDSGIDSGEGTPLLLLLDSAANAEVEAQRARYTGKVNEQGAMANAGLFRLQKDQAIVRGGVGVGTSLLTGAANAGGAYARYK